MSITMQYGPSAGTLGGAANLAGLGDYRRWLEEQALKQQSLAMQRQQMAQQQGQFEQGLEHQYYQDAQHNALAGQQQMLDAFRRQQELGLQYGQLGETARQHDLGYLKDTYKTNLAFQGQREHEGFQLEQQDRLFGQQAAMEDLKAGHHEQFYAFQLNEQQKRDMAELDRALDFVNQQEAAGNIAPEQAQEMRWEFQQRKAGIKAPKRMPPPPPEAQVAKNFGVFKPQLPDGSPNPFAGKPYYLDKDGVPHPFEFKSEQAAGGLDSKALEHFISGAEKAEQQASLNDGRPYDQARVEQMVQFRLRMYRENQLAAGGPPPGSGAGPQGVPLQQPEGPPPEPAPPPQNAESPYEEQAQVRGGQQQFDGAIAYRGFESPEFKKELTSFPQAKQQQAAPILGWLHGLMQLYPNKQQLSPDLQARIKRAVAFLDSLKGD